MKKLGTVKNVIHDGTILLRTSEIASPGTTVFDSRGAEVGRVVRVFGPVSEPYMSIKPKPQTESVGLIGSTLYSDPERQAAHTHRRQERRPDPKRHTVRNRSYAGQKKRGVNKWQRKEKPRKK